MKTQIIRAVIAAALASLAGIALRTYREHKERERRAANKAALQQWDTDGGGNPQHQYKAPAQVAARTPA